MDADTRHQLRQNELAEALSKIWDLSDRRSLTWLGVIVVIALAYAGYKYWGWRQQADLIQAERVLSSLNPADPSLGNAPLDQLRRLIAENSDPGLLGRARLLLAQGLEARGLGADGAEKLQQAERVYQEILAMPQAPAAVKAPATYRLGILYETRRDFESARKTYTSLSTDSGLAGSPFTKLAEARLESLDELSKPVEFEAGVRPLSTEETEEPAPDVGAAPETQPAGAAFEGPPDPAMGETPASETPPDESSEPQQP
jgi:hypothetical protein